MQIFKIFLGLLLCTDLLGPLLSAEPRSVVAFGLPMSGTLAEYGEAVRNGVTLAHDELRVKLESIEFRFDDTQYENARAVSIFQSWEADSGIILGFVFGYGPCQAVAPVAERRQLPMIAISAERGINVGKKRVLRFSFLAEQFAQALVSYMRSKKIKRTALVMTEAAYSQGIVDSMRELLAEDESLDLINSYRIGETDFRSSVARIKAGNYQAQAVFLFTGQVSEYFRQAHVAGLQLPALGLSPFESKDEIRRTNGLMNGAVFPSILVKEEFRKKYVATFGKDSQLGWAANAYDFVHVLAEAIARSRKPLTRDSFFAALQFPAVMQGAEGPISYREDERLGNRFVFPVVLKSIRGETFVDLGETTF